MSGLVVPKIECVESSGNYGRFMAEPLEKGFGVTLGNSLRRVLLGYLSGAAVTKVRIEAIQHEFSVIPHAKEDVMEFLLNVKAIRFRPVSGKPAKLLLEAQGEGPVTAGNIQPSNDVEVTNPELVLINLTDPEAKLVAEFDVDLGIGYKVAESTDSMPVGTIPIDAVFSPMRQVNFTVEPSHVGQETRERLFLDLWTDGTISATDALSQGAAILVEQLAPFQEYARDSQMEADERLIRMSIPNEKYEMPVEKLDLSVRTMNCLRRSGITTVGELIAKGPKELLKLRNFGQKSFQEIEEKLASVGLSLTPEAEESQPAEGAEAEGAEAEEAEGESPEAEAPEETPNRLRKPPEKGYLEKYMRHRVSGRKLNRPTGHRVMLYRNLVTDLIRYIRIVTTEAKAKEMRGFAERMITLGKVGGLHSYRQALSFVIDKKMVEKIFTELVTRYAQRPGGYTRITKLQNRPGDNAPMVKIELMK